MLLRAKNLKTVSARWISTTRPPSRSYAASTKRDAFSNKLSCRKKKRTSRSWPLKLLVMLPDSRRSKRRSRKKKDAAGLPSPRKKPNVSGENAKLRKSTNAADKRVSPKIGSVKDSKRCDSNSWMPKM